VSSLPDLSIRSPADVAEALAQLRLFAAAGYSLFPLRIMNKTRRIAAGNPKTTRVSTSPTGYASVAMWESGSPPPIS
jgi:hypothetical protein